MDEGQITAVLGKKKAGNGFAGGKERVCHGPQVGQNQNGPRGYSMESQQDIRKLYSKR